MLHLSAMAMGLGVKADSQRANEARKAFASISYGLVMGEEEETIPDVIKLEVKELVQNMFSIMPNIVH